MANPASDPDRDPLELLAADFARRLRNGEQPEVADYAAAHPDMAEDILELLPTVVELEKLKHQREQEDRSRFLRGPESLSQLGDFLIQAEIGRGGMGIVYEAVQQSLDRRVAVKVLPRQFLLDERRLQRFHREAQTAARLHHTNIVPIFGTGEQDGFHYYVMQLIPGLGLDRVVHQLSGRSDPAQPPSRETSSSSQAELAAEIGASLRRGRFQTRPSSAPSDPALGPAATPTPDAPPPSPASRDGDYFRSVARIGAEAADALQYAHQAGTLHRDIKPANLLLDAEGTVWITDFGLAKAIEHDNLTNSGDLVGTLQYMAPEQFSGRYDARSDIYCLGLTLYELLTLQPAFRGDNRSGLIQAVTEGRLQRPRRIQPQIPADLETIVLKAIAREPAHRYATAAELQEDLQRFLDRRPILARRANPLQTFARWCNRNRALAAALGFALCSLVIGGAYGLTAYGTASRELGRREATLSGSLEILDRVFQRIVGPALHQTVLRETEELGNEDQQVLELAMPEISADDRALLDEILALYDELARVNADQPRAQAATARAYSRIGDIQLRLRDPRKARESFRRALQRYGNDPAQALARAHVHNQLGQTLALLSDLDGAKQNHQAVLDLTVDDSLEDNAQARFERALAHHFLANWTPHQHLRIRLDTRSSLRERSAARRRELRQARIAASDPHRRVERNNQGIHLEAAQTLLRRLHAEAPKNLAFGLALSRNCRNLARYQRRAFAEANTGESLLERSRRRRAIQRRSRQLRQDALQILEKLLESHPGQQLLRYERCLNLLRPFDGRGRGPADGRRPPLAGMHPPRSRRPREHQLHEALQQCQALRREAPDTPAFLRLEVDIRRSMARGRAEMSTRRDHLEAAAKICTRLLALAPNTPEPHRLMALVLADQLSLNEASEALSGAQLAVLRRACAAQREVLRLTGREGGADARSLDTLLAELETQLRVTGQVREAAAIAAERLRLDPDR